MNPFGLDNHADNVRYYELMLERPDLANLPVYPLPDGFRFAMYQPGDRDAWIGIEYSAKEFHCFADGVRAWNNYYAPHETELPGRMVFVETADGEKVATATAFYDVRSDDHTDGWLHWVAVKREYQGMGLSKPLIAHTLGLLRAMGHTRTVIPTQTYTWLACKIYLDFGFRPIPANAVHSRNGWRIVRAITNHPALADFDPATAEEIFRAD